MSSATTPRPWRRRLLRGSLGVLALLGVLIGIAVVNTLTTRSQQIEVEAFEPLPVDDAEAIGRLSEAIRIPTISPEDPADFDPAPFISFHALLERSFPLVHAQLEREVVSDYSLMYRWQGADPNAAPIILTAHMDVVPVSDPAVWSHPPFAAEQAEGFLWGRGTMDDKGALMAILEAAEAMLAAGITPPRTVYLCFGHDEELQGTGTGAVEMAKLLHARGVEAEFVLDEGTGITVGLFPAVDQPVAVIGLSEKGSATIELVVELEGGHSSAPPDQTAVGILAAAVARVEAEQLPGSLDGPFRQTLATIGPEMHGPLKLVATNLWLFAPIMTRALLAAPTTASSVRTTTAVTVIEGGVKANVLPTRARALVNHRINAGDTVEGVVAHVRDAVDDPRVQVTLVVGNDVPRISDAEAPAFTTIARALREVNPEVLVAPGLFVAAADARHYVGVAEQVYRLSAFFITKQDVPRYHGIDERLALDQYAGMIQFYGRIMQAP
ncbi:M20/M25/M40 family metallo-hydrolase [Enhygromyxa salina]|uniref:Putative succinyl-diaminopimelate desuccinylase n=1 Tax=Enhygromyxa salina TaxID=215803 RepID=A0A2S9YFF0_9BACT|nr:M20/M25/M40 family metallo-hydrolase [Enhygromyxa salina]PRQ03809.1 putative succinyl-diaminopimelate desuccinylase [Enhygromyxa salina]